MAALLTLIREKSTPMHRDLETVLDITKQITSRAEYIALLKNFLALYEGWETRLREFAPQFQSLGIALAPRLRCPRLRQDLTAVNETPLAPAPAHFLPPIPNFAAAMGSLYVLEGSTLGGQVLTRHFAESLQIDPSALNFFRSHGPEVGRMWKSFCSALDQFGNTASNAEQGAAAEAAAQGFTSLMRWFGAEGSGYRA
jgi:heme oxygenase